MATPAFRYFVCALTLAALVEGVPFSKIQDYWNRRYCDTEDLTLAITCGDSYAQYMKWLEERLMKEPDLKDPTRCLYYKYDDIDEVDFIVIGAGVGGSVVAGRLSENPNWEVMVLEAGEAAPTGSQVPAMYFNYQHDPDFDWNYDLIPQDNVCLNTNGVCVYPRGKVMGGTAILHGMMYMRGNRADYDILKNDGIEGWSWNDVFPYFLKSENNLNINASWIEPKYHSVGGPLTLSTFNDHPEFAEDLLNGWKDLGYNINVDCNGKSQNGFMLAQATTEDGTRETTAKAYLYPHIKKRKNLYILPNSYVYRILINNKTKVAEGVLFERHGLLRIVRVRKEVIVSAGTIASPQILQLSGLGPKQDLENVGVTVIRDMPGVGQNLNNHASTEIFFRIGNQYYTEQLNDYTAKQYFENRTGPMSSTGLSQLTGFIWTNASNPDPRPDIQIFHAGFMANCSYSGYQSELVSPGHRIFSISPTLLNAKSTGYVKLRNNFPKSKPLIYGGILKEETDVERLLAGVKIALSIIRTEAMQRQNVYLDPTIMKGCENIPYNSDEYWLCYIAHKTNPENHQVGTCRMGAVDDPMAVTDSQLRVIGIKNIRMADASVYPRTPSGNLQGPTIMVAERAASFIWDTWNITCSNRLTNGKFSS